MASYKPYTKRGYAITKGTGRTPDDRVQSLALDDTDAAQAGDALQDDERKAELSSKRVRAAGVTAAGFPTARNTGENVTDDDLSPETLLRQQQDAGLQANDQILRVAGVREIGAGFGLDEAELAIAEAEISALDEEIRQAEKKRRK